VTQLSEEAIKLIVDTAVEKAVARIMESFGFEDDERKELKADFPTFANGARASNRRNPTHSSLS
jgi:hypothetical protein